jgi:hypothetical protein
MKYLTNENLMGRTGEWQAVVCVICLSLAFSFTTRGAVFCTGDSVPVTVFASSSAIAEGGGATVQFVFTVGGPIGGGTLLTLQISGTAADGVDYQSLTTNVTIPSGQTSAALTVTPIADAVSEGTETITITIVSEDNACVYIGSSSNATISIVEANTGLATALDGTNLLWSTSSNAAWSGLSPTTHDGVDAAESGLVSDNQESWVHTVVDGPGTLTFWWKVSSETDFDWLRFHIDGILQQQISGEVNWQQRSFQVPQGSHTLRWRYVKDSNSAFGQDRAWLDQVSFTSASGGPVIASQPANQTAWEGANVTLNSVALGAGPLIQQWFFNDTNIIPNATASSLVLNNVSLAQGGHYRFFVSNALGSATSSIATVTVTANGPVTQVLLFSDSLVASPFEAALANLGQTFQRFSDEFSFNSAVNAANRATTLVIVDAPQNFYGFSSLAGFVNGGGRVLIQAHSFPGNPALGATFQIIIESRSSAPLPLYNWTGSPLFADLPSPLTFTEINLDEDAQRLHPVGDARAVAGFASAAASGQSAIVIGNSGRTIVNGFYVEAALSTANAVKFAQNEIAFLIGAIGPPLFLAQPQDRFLAMGGTAAFGVTVVGERPLTYQWRKDGQPLSGATAPNYTISSVQSNHFGAYDVIVSNSLGSATSRVATLDLSIPLVLRQGPLNQTAVAGGSVTFSAEISGYPPPFTYQWRRISPAPLFTNRFESTALINFFTLSNVQAATAGTYRLVVSNRANTNGVSFTQFTLTILADDDGDGMADVWESQYGVADASLDADGDGSKNLEEYVAGTDPTNSISALKFVSIATVTPPTLQFNAVSNRTYTIQCTDSLSPANWSRVADVVARSSNRVENITNSTDGSQRYFRIITPRQP